MSSKSKEPKDSKPQEIEKKPDDYSSVIDKLREGEPHKNTNKYIQSLIDEAVSKAKESSYSNGFWNGLLIGVVVSFVLWIVFAY